MHTVTVEGTNLQYYGYSGRKEANRGYRDRKTSVLQRLPKMHTVAIQYVKKQTYYGYTDSKYA